MPKTFIGKEGILEKASLLFWQHGYERTSMRDIAFACGFDPANLYNYFAHKEEILFEVLLNELEEFVNAVRYLENDDTLPICEQLRSFVTDNLSRALTRNASSRILFDAEMKNLSPRHLKQYIQRRDRYERILRKILHRGIKKGVFAPIDERMAAYATMSMLARSRIWYSPRGRLSVAQIADFIYEFAIHGLGVKKDKLT